MGKSNIIGLIIIVLLLAGIIKPSHADTSSSVLTYIKLKKQLRQAPLSAQSIQSVQNNPESYKGQALEISATITGQVAAGSDRTLLLSLENTTLYVTLPVALKDETWFDAGKQIRVLFSIDPPKKDQMDPSPLHVVAAAPEYDVAAVEKQEAQMRERSTLTSRSMPYRSTRIKKTNRVITGPTQEYDYDGGHPVAVLSDSACRVYGRYHAAIRSFNKRLSDEDLDKITTSILYFSEENDIDPRLIVAMIIAESDFDIHSTSSKGAMGLTQLMPSTARGMGLTDAYDPVQNIGASVRILRGHLDKYGGAPPNAGIIPYNQIRLIMAAYNAGPGAVRKYHGVPPYRETQRYVERVASLYRAMCRED